MPAARNRSARSVSRLPIAAAASLLCLALAAPAGAEQLGVFKDWTAHKVDVDGNPICFVESRPASLDAAPSGRDAEDVRVTVTHRPSRGIFSALLFETGYPLDDKVLAEIAIDGDVYYMGSEPNGYFYVTEAKDERRLLDAMKAGLRLEATGTRSDGSTSTDAYSLSGITAALNAIDQACPQ